MARLDRCGNCGSIQVMPGLNTVQCLECGYITRSDGVLATADGRFTKTLHEKHQDANMGEVPIEG